MRKNEKLYYASLCDTCNLGNNDENYCKNVTTVAKKNGDIITIMRHYEYINMKILKTCKVCGKPSWNEREEQKVDDEWFFLGICEIA